MPAPGRAKRRSGKQKRASGSTGDSDHQSGSKWPAAAICRAHEAGTIPPDGLRRGFSGPRPAIHHGMEHDTIAQAFMWGLVGLVATMFVLSILVLIID